MHKGAVVFGTCSVFALVYYIKLSVTNAGTLRFNLPVRTV